MVMSPFEGSPPLEACTVDAILGRIYTIKRGLVRGLPSKMAKPTYQPSYRRDGLGGVPLLGTTRVKILTRVKNLTSAACNRHEGRMT